MNKKNNSYGLPYLGSKNSIAKEIISALPPAENFYDLFCGGGALLCRAIESRKYKNFYANDINKLVINGLEKAFSGYYKTENRWISKEDFWKLKDTDFYVYSCFSFGNKGTTYCYGTHIEPWKKAIHYARVFNDFSLLKEFGIDTDDASSSAILKREKEYKEKYINWYLDNYNIKQSKIKNISNLCMLESLERLNRLQSLERLNRLQTKPNIFYSSKSYDEIEIKPNSIIICDIPYRNTCKYSIEKTISFDYDKFYNWCKRQTQLVFINEYSMPNDFIKIKSIVKRRLLLNFADEKSPSFNEEGLYIPKHLETLYNSYNISLI